MKSFLKYTLATIVGLIIVNLLVFLVFIGIMGAVVGLSDQTFDVKDNTVLRLSFDTAIPDRASENPLDNIDIMTLSASQQTGLNKILAYINQAKTDSRISGIYLDLTEINSNFGALATIEEIRDALDADRFEQWKQEFYENRARGVD